MQCRALGRRCLLRARSPCSATSRRPPRPGRPRSWAESLAHLGHPDAEVEELVAGFRVPGAVIDFAARLLPRIAPQPDPAALGPPAPGRARSPAQLGGIADDVIIATTASPGARGHRRRDRARRRRTDASARRLEKADSATTCWARTRRSSTPGSIWCRPSLAKGLEFDHVVLLEPADIVAGEPDEVTGLRRLYVCLTRAVTSLVVVHSAPLPAALAA